MMILDKQSLFDRIDRMRSLYVDANLPHNVHLDITYRCDLDCVHCYLDEKNEWPELTTEEWLDVIDQIAAAGVWEVIWSGGEVFARPDFPQLLARAHEHGIRSRVKTHAGNIGSARAQYLRDHGVWRADVSLYSLDASVHDGITGRPGSMVDTLAGLEALVAAGLKVRVSVSVFRANMHELDAIEAHLVKLGCDPSYNATFFPDNGGTDLLDDLELSGDEMTEVLRTITRIRAERHGRENIDRQPYNASGTPCGAGRTSGYVSPDGAVWPCVQFPMALGHLREQSFAEIWRDSPQRKQLVAFTNADRNECSSCAGAASCLYCPGEAYRRTGDFRKAPEIFHARSRARMIAQQDVLGMEYSEADFASVPAVSVAAPRTHRKRNFAFPIYRPSKGRPKRVTQTARSAGT